MGLSRDSGTGRWCKMVIFVLLAGGLINDINERTSRAHGECIRGAHACCKLGGIALVSALVSSHFD